MSEIGALVAKAKAARKYGDRERELQIYRDLNAYAPEAIPAYVGRLAADTAVKLRRAEEARGFFHRYYLGNYHGGVLDKIALDSAGEALLPDECRLLFTRYRKNIEEKGLAVEADLALARSIERSGDVLLAIDVLKRHRDARISSERIYLYLSVENWAGVLSETPRAPLDYVAVAIASAELHGLNRSVGAFREALVEMGRNSNFSPATLATCADLLSNAETPNLRFAQSFSSLLILLPKWQYANRLLRLFIPSQIEISEDYYCCATSLARIQKTPGDIRSIAIEDRKLNGVRAINLFLAGVAEYQDHNKIRSEIYFHLARSRVLAEISNGELIFTRTRTHSRTLAHFCMALTWSPRLKLSTLKYHIEMPATPTTEPSLVHVVGCDAGYMRRFLPTLLQISEAQLADPAMVVTHCNVMNPTEDDMEFMQEIASRYPLLEFSTTHIDRAYERMSFYTCLRFLAMPQLLARFSAPLLITDIDACARYPWPEIVPRLRNYDLAFSAVDDPFSREDIPCMVGGGATLVSNTRVGRTFAKKVVATIEQQYDLSNVTNWVIDQVALRRGILEVERRHGSLATVKAFRRVGSPMIFANAYHSKEAFVESMGGKKA